jgi:hypothetical protein
MPANINPISISKSPIVQLAVKQCMIEWSTDILINETPIVSPNSGYKAYDKRMNLAKQVIQNPDMYVEIASRLVATIYPSIECDGNANHRFLVSGNGKGLNFMRFQVIYDDFNENGGTPGEIGQQLWDSLAGVTAADLL